MEWWRDEGPHRSRRFRSCGVSASGVSQRTIEGRTLRKQPSIGPGVILAAAAVFAAAVLLGPRLREPAQATAGGSNPGFASGPLPTQADGSPANLVDVGPWYAPVGDQWLVSDGRENRWMLPIREKPQAIRSGVLLTASLDLVAPSTTLHTYDVSSGNELWSLEVEPPVNAAAFWKDKVIFAPSSIDGGVWTVTPGRDDATRILESVVDHKPLDIAEYTRVTLVSSGTAATAASEVIVRGGNAVDIFGPGDDRHRLLLPDGSWTVFVSDSVLIIGDDGGFSGLAIDDGKEIWALPAAGAIEGAYVSSTRGELVVGLYDQKGSGDLQLLAVSLADGAVRVVDSWAAGAPQPHFMPALSSDEAAFFADAYGDIDSFVASDRATVTGRLVELSDGSSVDASVGLGGLK